jgi:hypothetical protein
VYSLKQSQMNFLDCPQIVRRPYGQTRRGLKLPHGGGGYDSDIEDVSSLLHLPNEGRLLDHQSLSRVNGVDLMVELLGSESTDAAEEVNNTKGVHAKHTYLKDHFKNLLEHIAHNTAEQNEDEAKRH